jgi:hypothetical protein
MQEETKEEFIIRMRREKGIVDDPDPVETPPDGRRTLREKISGVFFAGLLILFFALVLYVFGMMKGN